jgi:hypothetical protein
LCYHTWWTGRHCRGYESRSTCDCDRGISLLSRVLTLDTGITYGSEVLGSQSF